MDASFRGLKKGGFHFPGYKFQGSPAIVSTNILLDKYTLNSEVRGENDIFVVDK